MDLKKYFFVIGVVAALILLGTFWYTNFHSQGTKIASGGSTKDPAAAVKSAVNWFPRQFGGGNSVARAPVAAPDSRLIGGAPTERAMTAAPAKQPMGMARAGGGVAMARPEFLLAKGTFSDIVRAMHDSVVSITAARATRGQLAPTKAADQPKGNGVFFSNPFSGRTVENIGSGVIVRSDGYIVTNFHIVRGTNAVSVNVFEGPATIRYRSMVVKMDETLDLALLKIEPTRPLTAAVLGNSDELRVADNVIAIGSPFGLDQTVSRGIVSALRKSMVIEGVNHTNLIQTDAAINQGNSGGPLIAENGTVIGINTAIYTPTGAFSGISFAIPSNMARQFVASQINSMAGNATGGRVLPVAMQARGGTAGAIPVAGGGLRFAGPPSGLAMNVAGAGGAAPTAGGAAPTIVAGTPSPHKDGRQKLDCLTCHKLVATANAIPVAFTPPFGTFSTGLAMNVAAPLPRDPGPTIDANSRVPGNHRDGRDRMNCAFCHRIEGGGVNPVAFATQPGNSFSGMPTNIAAPAPAVNPGRVGIGEVTLGAALMRIDGALSDRINHPERKGVFVSKVKSHSLAEAAGLKAGDIILKVDGRRMRGPSQLVAALADRENGETARIGVLRRNRKVNLTMIVAGLANMSGLPPTTALSPNTGMPIATGPQNGAMAMPPRRVPKDFNWKGMEVENFTQIPARGARGGKPRLAARINEVKRGSPADRAGIRVNDMLLEINGRLVGNPRLMDKAIRKSKGQNNNLLKLMRGPQEFFTLLQ
ncbi:MAG: trypsin-like peptidase domain-containing protein [Alphaproteobacteria bacterium]